MALDRSARAETGLPGWAKVNTHANCLSSLPGKAQQLLNSPDPLNGSDPRGRRREFIFYTSKDHVSIRSQYHLELCRSFSIPRDGTLLCGSRLPRGSN
jgi:hypothetical protein